MKALLVCVCAYVELICLGFTGWNVQLSSFQPACIRFHSKHTDGKQHHQADFKQLASDFVQNIPTENNGQYTCLSQRKLLQECFRFVCFSKLEVWFLRADLDIGPAVLGSDQPLVGSEVIRVRVQCLKWQDENSWCSEKINSEPQKSELIGLRNVHRAPMFRDFDTNTHVKQKNWRQMRERADTINGNFTKPSHLIHSSNCPYT